MATATAEIAIGASGYRGDPALGGGSFGSFQLDTKPIEDLARYTLMYNRSEYDQRQKDAEKAADEIADYTSYDLTSGIEKDAKLLQEKYDKLTAYVRDNPNALDYRNKKQWAEYKKLRNDLDNDLRGGKVRNTMFALRQKEIQEETNPIEKARLQKKLNEEIAATDIRTPLKYSDKFSVQPVEVSGAPIKKVQVTEIGRNFVGQESWELPDMDAVTNQALSVSSGLLSLADYENTETFQSRTPQEQELLRQQFQAASASGKLEPVESARNLNSAILTLADKKDASGKFIYKNEDGTFNIQKMIESGEGIISNVLQQVDLYNKQMDQMQRAIDGGWFKDDFGNELHFSNDASGLKKSSYSKINVEDGLTPEELIKMRILANSAPTNRTVKVDQTNIALTEAQQKETKRHNIASEGIQAGQLALEREKWNKTMIGGETVKNGAMEFAKRLYSDLEKLADQNGVISPDKLRKLNVEQRKYLGVEVPQQRDEDGKILEQGGFKPLDASGEKVIQLIGGRNINVFVPLKKDGKIEKTEDGRYVGQLDNTKSTTLFNIATNRLNEQLKNAGAKELNAYMAIDLGTGGVTTNTTGGTTTQSGGTTIKETDAEYYKRTGQFRTRQ